MNETELYRLFEELNQPVADQKLPVSCHHYVADEEVEIDESED